MRFRGRGFGHSGVLRLLLVVSAAIVLAAPAQAQRIQGAGSTFAFPVISAWKQSFLQKRADGSDFVVDDLGVDYEPVGSLGGIMRLAQPDIDFAASDAPLPPEELAKRDLAQFPIVIGGLAVAVNLDGVKAGQLKLTGDLLAQIYLGKIKRWSDPAILAVNSGLSLPDIDIIAVHRSDGSGSTATFTRYLAAANGTWRSGPGSDTLIDWPAGKAAEGTGGMVDAVKQTSGAIAYLEFGQAHRQGLAVVQLANKAGTFVPPGPEVFASTAASADWDAKSSFYLQLTDVDEAGAYPLTAATFVLMHRTQRSASRTRRTLFFLSHALEDGGTDAAALGYVALPDPVVEKIKTYWHDVLPGATGL